MTDHSNPPKSEQHDTGFVRKNELVQTEMDNEVRTLQEADGEGSIPEEAGHDFTFPDENETLGRKTGNDLPGQTDQHRD